MIQPSYKSGYSIHDESEAPERWRGLRSLWAPKLGVTGGKLRDLGPLGNDGALEANVVWSPSPLGWTAETTLDHIVVSSAISNTSNAFTIFFSLVLDNVTSSNQYIYDQSTTRIVFWLQNAAFTTFIAGSEVVTAGHGVPAGGIANGVFVTTQSPYTRKVWCNGIQLLDDTTAFTDWGASSGVAALGSRNNGSNLFDGRIAMIGIADRAWTAAEAVRFGFDPFALLRPRHRVFAVPAVAGRFVSIGGIFIKQNRVVVGG